MIELNEMQGSGPRSRFFIGVPFALLVVLALPLMVLLAPVVLLACLALRVNPFDMAAALWNLLTALRGTHVEVTEHHRSVLVHIS